jgi:DNA-directed RNA polymerase specialized sigma24 family protein
MPVDAEVLRRARKGNVRAAIDVLGNCYPQVYRIAYGLSGRDDVGRGVVRFIMRRGLRLLPTWHDDGDPDRWCQHHTVLTTRRAARHQPDVAHDTLVRGAQTDNAYYAAFVRAIRALPPQQREAFILHHGEQFDVRALGIAMDCSQDAAGQHLKEATRSLSTLGGDYFATFTAQLAHTYKALTPSEELVLTNITWDAKKYLWPRRVWRWIKLFLMALIIALIVLFVWKIYPKLVY